MMITIWNRTAEYSRRQDDYFSWSERVEKQSEVTFLNEIVFTLGSDDEKYIH